MLFLSLHPLSTLKKARDLFAPFDKNLLRAASFPLRLCMSFSVLGWSRSVTALTFEGLAFMPCLVMRCPKKGPSSTPNEHFFRFSFMLIEQNLSKGKELVEYQGDELLGESDTSTDGFMHEVNNPDLTKRLNDHIHKTVEETMSITTVFIRAETATASKKKGQSSWKPQDPPIRQGSDRKHDF
ncbi:hypothetical protein Tco_0588927 [Tanacetum coccineum]